MGIGLSIVIFAIGAVLTFALTREADGINLDTVGIILMVVGVVGLIVSMVFWSSWGPYGRRRERTLVTEVPVVRDRVA